MTQANDHDFGLLDDVATDSMMDHEFDFCLGVGAADENTTYTPRFHWAPMEETNNSNTNFNVGGNQTFLEEDADPELQTLLMELENDGPSTTIPIGSNADEMKVKTNAQELSVENNQFSKAKGNAVDGTACSSICTCDPQLSQVCSYHAKLARKRRKAVLSGRRRSRSGVVSSASLENQERIEEEHKQQTLEALESPAPIPHMEDVMSIVHQLVLTNNPVNNIPRNVSQDELNSTSRNTKFRSPSPVFSSPLIQKASTAIPDTATSSSSFLPSSQRSTSLPPSSGRRKSNGSSTKSRGRSTKRSSSSAQANASDTPLPEGDDPESRRQRRLIRNRMSAQLHRERKREAMDTLQRLINERDAHIRTLEEQLQNTRKNQDALEKALGVIQNHFGKSVIQNVLLQQNATKVPPSSPPHLVNGSDMSSCVSDEDENSFSVITSPVPSSSSFPEENKESAAMKTPIPQLSIPSNTDKKLDGKIRVASKKRKASPWNVALMAPLCVCAFMACFISSNHQTAPLTAVPVEPSHTHTADNTKYDMRRRLLSATSSSTGESLLDQILSENEQDEQESSTTSQDWIFSPLERYPASWKVNSASELKYPTPWAYEESELLFDFRSKINESLPMENNLKKHINTSHSSKTKTQLRGSFVRKEKVKVLKEESKKNYTTSFPSLKTPLLSLKNAFSNNSQDTVNADDPSLPNNFLFCPNAHAKLSSDFLQLTKHDTSPSADVDISSSDDYQEPSNKDSSNESDLHEEIESDIQSRALVPSFDLANSENKSELHTKAIYKASLTDDAHSYMSILLPVSAISGGVTHPSRTEPWIELGCQVLSAKIVHGVTFMDGNSSSKD